MNKITYSCKTNGDEIDAVFTTGKTCKMPTSPHIWTKVSGVEGTREPEGTGQVCGPSVRQESRAAMIIVSINQTTTPTSAWQVSQRTSNTP